MSAGAIRRDRRLAMVAVALTLSAVGGILFLVGPLHSVAAALTIVNESGRSVAVRIDEQTTGRSWTAEVAASDEATIVLHRGDDLAGFGSMVFVIEARDGEAVVFSEEMTGRVLVDGHAIRVVIGGAAVESVD